MYSYFGCMAEPSGGTPERVAGFVDFDRPRGTRPSRRAAIPATVYEDQSHVAAEPRAGITTFTSSSPRILQVPARAQTDVRELFEVLSGRDARRAAQRLRGVSRRWAEEIKTPSRDGRRAFSPPRRRSPSSVLPRGLRQRVHHLRLPRDAMGQISSRWITTRRMPEGGGADGQRGQLGRRRDSCTDPLCHHLYFGVVDFINVEGIEGVYIANQIANDAFVSPEVAGGSRGFRQDASPNGGAATGEGPPVDVPNPSPATPTMRVYLHGASHWQRGVEDPSGFGVFATVRAGVVLATGNVGEYLSATRKSPTRSSRAAAPPGRNPQGPHIYELKPRGLIVVARWLPGSHHEGAVSRDEGRSWEESAPARDACTPRRSRPDRLRHPRHSGIHGGRRMKGLIYTLDFSKLNDRSGSTGPWSMRRREGWGGSSGAGKIQRASGRKHGGASPTGRVLPERSTDERTATKETRARAIRT